MPIHSPRFCYGPMVPPRLHTRRPAEGHYASAGALVGVSVTVLAEVLDERTSVLGIRAPDEEPRIKPDTPSPHLVGAGGRDSQRIRSTSGRTGLRRRVPQTRGWAHRRLRSSRPHSTTASASNSISQSGSMKRVTCMMVLAGRIAPKFTRRARRRPPASRRSLSAAYVCARPDRAMSLRARGPL